MKNFKGASALQRKLICESLCSLCCPECIWGEEEEPVPCSYCQVYHMWVSQDINIPRQLKALEQAVFRWSPLVWASPGQFGREAACLQSSRGPAPSKFPALIGILWSCISPGTAPPPSLPSEGLYFFPRHKMALWHLPIVQCLDASWCKAPYSHDNGQQRITRFSFLEQLSFRERGIWIQILPY